MQKLVFLACFYQKLLKKNLWGFGSTPFSKGRVKGVYFVDSPGTMLGIVAMGTVYPWQQ